MTPLLRSHTPESKILLPYLLSRKRKAITSIIMRFITPITLFLSLTLSVSAFTCPDSELALCCKSFTVSGGQKLGNDCKLSTHHYLIFYHSFGSLTSKLTGIGAPYVLVNGSPSYSCPIGKGTKACCHYVRRVASFFFQTLRLLIGMNRLVRTWSASERCYVSPKTRHQPDQFFLHIWGFADLYET